MSTSGDLDQLCESVSDLRLGERTKEAEVEESVHGGMVSTETVLVVSVVHSDLDGYRSINQTNDRGGNTDKVGVSAV